MPTNDIDDEHARSCGKISPWVQNFGGILDGKGGNIDGFYSWVFWEHQIIVIMNLSGLK